MLNISTHFAYAAALSVSLILLTTLVLLAILILEVAMFIHVLRNKSINDSTKALWIIGMLLVHPVVAVAYYFTDRKKSLISQPGTKAS